MIGLLIVSHSSKAAEGIREIALEMGGDEATIAAVGGDPDGGIGSSISDIQDTLETLLEEVDGVVILADLAASTTSPKATVDSVRESAEDARDISKV